METFKRKFDRYAPMVNLNMQELSVVNNLHYFQLHYPNSKYLQSVLKYLSDDDARLWYDYKRTYKTHDLQSTGILLNGVESRDVVPNFAFTGKGEIISVIDTGLDFNHCAFKPGKTPYRATFTGNNANAILSAMPITTDKVLMYINLQDNTGIEEETTDFDDIPDGHGTHVAGSAVGSSAMCESKVFSHHSDSQIIFVDIGKGNETALKVPTFMTPLLNLLYEAKSRIFSNSYGSAASVYDIHSYELDRFVYLHDDAVIVFAAGNAGPDPSTIASPSYAKNVIAVGCSQNSPKDAQLEFDSNWSPNKNPMHANSSFMYWYNSEHLSLFSSRGPTFDGRIKPDVVAVGEYVLSARAHGKKDSMWVYKRGSSMGGPETVRGISYSMEYLKIVKKMKSPSASLMRNILTTTAYELESSQFHYHQDTVSNLKVSHEKLSANSQGFGRVDLHALFSSQLLLLDRQHITTFSKPFKRCYKSDLSQSVSIGLAWTDPPAHIHAEKTLVNDLDLETIVNNHSRTFGNGNWNTSDNLNNVERIRLRLVENDLIVLIVSAKSEVKAYPPVSAQFFSLVIKGSLTEISCDNFDSIGYMQLCEFVNGTKVIDPADGVCKAACNKTHVLIENNCQCRNDIYLSNNTALRCSMTFEQTIHTEIRSRNLASKKISLNMNIRVVFTYLLCLIIVTLIVSIIVFFKV
jgi:hypothetical protein